MRDGLPPRFKIALPPRPVALQRRENAGRHRISPRKRGYDARWDKASQGFRRSHPWCYFCCQERAEADWEPTAVTDHVLPAHEFPKLRYVKTNWLPLCEHHHNQTKARLEAYARANDCLPLLAQWCRQPMTRPVHLRPISVIEGWELLPDVVRLAAHQAFSAAGVDSLLAATRTPT